MKREQIQSQAQQALDTGRVPLKTRFNSFAVTTSLAASSLWLSATEFCANAGIEVKAPTIALTLGLSYLAWKSLDSEYAALAIEDGIADQKAYGGFVKQYVTHHMVPRLTREFNMEDPDIGLNIHGVSSEAFQLLLAAEILGHSADYQEETRRTETSGAEDIVQNILETQKFPEINRTLAERLRQDAQELSDAIPKEQRHEEGNWDFSEMEEAAKEIGGLLGDHLHYELQHAFTVERDATPMDLTEKLLFGRKMRRQKIKDYVGLQQDTYSDLAEIKSTIEHVVLRRGGNHRRR